MEIYAYFFIFFFASILLTKKIVPFAKEIGIKFNAYDIPNNRKEHQKPIVRIGSLAILFGAIIALSLQFLLPSGIEFLNYPNVFFAVLICSLLFFTVGFLDDLISLSPFSRLFAQITISILFISLLNYKYIFEFYNNDGVLIPFNLPILFTQIISIFWLVGITNSINWIDGIDGLASSLSAIVSFSLGIFFIFKNNPSLASISFCISGSSLGFLSQNLKPNNILMGDGGSYFLGFSIGALSLLTLETTFEISDIFVPIFFVYFPFFDMIRVIFTRIINRKSPFFPDRIHLHHILKDKGLNNKQILIFLTLISIACCFIGISFSFEKFNFLLLISAMILILWQLFSNKKILFKKGNNLNNQSQN